MVKNCMGVGRYDYLDDILFIILSGFIRRRKPLVVCHFFSIDFRHGGYLRVAFAESSS
jgi:hypothetical protein